MRYWLWELDFLKTFDLKHIYVGIFFRLLNDISDVHANIMAEAMMLKLEELGVGVWVTANTKVKKMMNLQ